MHHSPLPETPAAPRAAWHEAHRGGPLLDRAQPPEGPPVSRSAIVRIATGLVVLLLGASVITTAEEIPPHPLVLAASKTKTYYAPACAIGQDLGVPQTLTRAPAEAQGHHADIACAQQGGFLGNKGTRWSQFLEAMRLLPRRESRWRADGTWRR